MWAFGKYLFSAVGGNIMYKFPSDNPKLNQGKLEKIIGFPIASNSIGRFFRVSDQGLKERIMDEVVPIREDIKALPDDSTTRQQARSAGKLYRKLVKEGTIDPYKTEYTDFHNKYMSYIRKGSSAIQERLDSALSNEEKEAILGYLAKESETPKEYRDHLKDAYKSGSIGKNVVPPRWKAYHQGLTR